MRRRYDRRRREVCTMSDGRAARRRTNLWRASSSALLNSGPRAGCGRRASALISRRRARGARGRRGRRGPFWTGRRVARFHSKRARPRARDQSLLVEEAERGDGVRMAAEHELGLGRGSSCRQRARPFLCRADGGAWRLQLSRAKVSRRVYAAIVMFRRCGQRAALIVETGNDPLSTGATPKRVKASARCRASGCKTLAKKDTYY